VILRVFLLEISSKGGKLYFMKSSIVAISQYEFSSLFGAVHKIRGIYMNGHCGSILCKFDEQTVAVFFYGMTTSSASWTNERKLKIRSK
jgi:hypothetical protein